MTNVFPLVDLLATLALAPFVLFLLLIVVGAFAGRRRSRPVGREGPGSARFLVVIPAHDEEEVIAQTVRSCLALDYPSDLFAVWVIVDNCTDATAEVARRAGARVVIRENNALRSKGHALEYFFSEVPEGRPGSGYDAAVLVDADTVVDPDLLHAFATGLAKGWDWIQGYYSVRNPDASWRTRMMTYAFSLANGSWMLGLERLGLGVGLKGNGMCFSSRGLARCPWKSHGLVEDMEFALTLRARGERVHFDREALVLGEMVSRGGPGAASQRRRWEAGRKALRKGFVGPIARSKSIGPIRKLCYLIELYFPPLALMGSWLGLLIILDGLAEVTDLVPHGFRRLEGAHLGMVMILALYAVSPIVTMNLPARYLVSLCAFPYYVGWKLAIAAGRKPRSWVRTPRESAKDQDPQR